MGADLYDSDTWKNYVSQGSPWKKTELRLVKEIMKNGGGFKEAALRVSHSPGAIQTKIFNMGKDFFDESTWDKYAIEQEKNMEYPKAIMNISELKRMGFPRALLLEAYRDPKQNFATKVDPSKSNSTIIFDTAGFDKWIAKRIKLQIAEFASQRRRPARGAGWKMLMDGV